jgi:hypothetical protein
LKKILLLAIIGIISIIVTTGFTIAETTPAKTTEKTTPAKTPTSNIKPGDGESATSIRVTFVTSTGERISYNIQKVVQWVQLQVYSDRKSPQLELDSTPSTDKTFLYDMVKRKFEGDAKATDPDIILEAITKDNKVIITTKYVSCAVDQYWLWTDTDEQQYRFLKSDNIEPREQFFFKCKGYSINPTK